MPTYQKFEELPVWQASAELYDRIDDLIDRAPPRMRAVFRNRLEQAALAVSQNIATGFVRGKDGLPFLDAAHAAAAEVQVLSSLALRQPYLSALKNDLFEIQKVAEMCARQLFKWAEAIQNPTAKGKFQRREPQNGRDAEEQPRPIEHAPRNSPPTQRPRYERPAPAR